jgi:hypothetical protein
VPTQFFVSGRTGYAFFADADEAITRDLSCTVSFNPDGYLRLSRSLLSRLPASAKFALLGFDAEKHLIVIRLYPTRFPGTVRLGHKGDPGKLYIIKFLTALGIPDFTAHDLPARWNPLSAEILVAFPHEALDRIGRSLL